MLTELLVVAKILLFVQQAQSSVAGAIRDGETGQPLADAVVTLDDLDRTAGSDSGGRYTFLDVPPGPQHLSIKRIGYAPRTLHALVPREGRLEINIALHPIPMRLPGLVARSTVTIRGLESGDSTPFPDRGISMAAVRNDPLLAEPDALLGLSGGEILASLETPSGIHVRGGASDQTRYLLDGVPVFSPYHAAGTFSAWNPDALERTQVFSTSPSPAFPDALAGTVSAVTRTPGSLARVQGGMSTTQARLAVDGPLGLGRAGYLVSFRAGFPALVAPRHDGSYLGGDTRDLMAKLDVPIAGSGLRLLLYDTENRISSTAALEPAQSEPPANRFEWSSRSVGAQWNRSTGLGTLRIQTWSASSESDASWSAGDPLGLAGSREDVGLLVTVEQKGSKSSTTAGARLEHSHTSYRVAPIEGTGSLLELSARTPVRTVFVQHGRETRHGLGWELALGAASAAEDIYLNLQSQFRWHPTLDLGLTAGFTRSHQFSQSLRNEESVVGNVFPADLFIGATASRVPVARNDRAVIAADYRPVPGLRVGAQAYVSYSSGLLLVAPRTNQPFATSGFTTGTGTAPGLSLDAALSGSRYGLLARYGWQRVRLEYADSSYVPSYGTHHLLELGAIVFPSATSSIRLGLTGATGRRATAVTGDFEWEACNLLDRGCEFGGSPETAGAPGATRLPAYFRLDLSLRKHWHLHLGTRDVTLAVFGTVTNLLGRDNVLTVVTDPITGRRSSVEMRPLAPLVAGFDWRF